MTPDAPRRGPGTTTAARTAATGAGRWDGRLWTLLFILSGNMVLDAIEVSVVLVALPSIGADLGMSPLTVQWLMSGFALGFAALLPLGAWITARWGRRRAYLAAMAVFAAASVAGGLADGPALLIATRILKGLCAALTAPTGLAIISTTFRDGPDQRRAVSVYSLFGAAGFTMGALLSGALLEAGWRWTFLFPAPVALALMLLGLGLLPPDPPATGAPAGPRPGLLRDGRLRRSALGAASLNGTYAGLLLLVTFQCQERFGWAPWKCALALLPACVPLAVTVPFAGRLVARHGTARLVALGALTPFAGCALYLWRPEGRPYATAMLPVLLLVEAGFVLAFAALNMQATATVPAAQRGRAVPLYQTGVQLGGVLTLPAVGALLTTHDGYRPALSLLTAVSAVGLVTAVAGLRAPAPGAGTPDHHAQETP
ncbi:MFS transporter [Streptomyces triculaminicus]|uniref:MFS transporter n=1 Tax=Streptomyces triculaminicus TaxID=2816232 RepID=UPI0037D0A031